MEVRRKNVGYAARQWVQDYKVREVDAGMWAVLDKVWHSGGLTYKHVHASMFDHTVSGGKPLKDSLL